MTFHAHFQPLSQSALSHAAGFLSAVPICYVSTGTHSAANAMPCDVRAGSDFSEFAKLLEAHYFSLSLNVNTVYGTVGLFHL